MSAIDPPSGFYVYRLCDPDTGLPFYVGKGQGRRAWQHEVDVRKGRPGSNAQKIARIKSIIDAGGSVVVEIVASYLRETDALDHEYRLVDADASLTNVAPGGIGTTMSPFRLRKMKEEQARRLLRQRQEALKAAAERDQEREAEEKRRLLLKAKGDHHRSEIETWAASLPSGVKVALHRPSPTALRLQAKKRREEANQRRNEMKEAGEIGTYSGRTYPRGRGLYGKYR